MQTTQMCTICQQQPQQLLILSCQHNLCVSCATQVYLINQKCNPFSCEICLEQTQLNEETIASLIQLTQRKTPQNKKTNNELLLSAITPSQIQEKASVVLNAKGKKLCKQQAMCKVHGQVVLYYCFDCQGGDICSQCILTSKHSGHKVVTLKKAVSFMIKRVHEQIKEKQLIRDQLNAQITKYQAASKYVQTQVQEKKTEIKNIFDSIMSSITECYDGLLSQLHQQANTVQQMLNGCLREVHEKYGMIKQAIHYDKQFAKNNHQQQMLRYFPKLNCQNYELYYPRLPRQIPHLSVHIHNSDAISGEIDKLIRKIYMNKREHENIDHRNSFEFSVIHPQILNDLAEDSVVMQTALKQSRRQHYYPQQSVSNYRNQSGAGHGYRNDTSSKYNKNSRKLEMSRSIDNATYIINKLQERSVKN